MDIHEGQADESDTSRVKAEQVLGERFGAKHASLEPMFLKELAQHQCSAFVQKVAAGDAKDRRFAPAIPGEGFRGEAHGDNAGSGPAAWTVAAA